MSSTNIFLIICLVMASFVFAKVVVKKGTNYTNEGAYTVVTEKDSFEIRQYQASIVASVDLGNGTYDNLSNKGFRKLANYIFGGNNQNQKIAMTSPVMMNLGDSSSMHFFMPDGYDLENLPSPNNAEVELQKLEPKKVAVIKFGGWANQSRIDKYQKKLDSLLKEEGIEHTGVFSFLGYNSPYEVTNRRNEVIVELK